jgi:hypothetical protein
MAEGAAMSEGMMIALVVVLFTVVFSAMWLGITGLLYVMSGWKRLATEFPDTPEPAMQTFAMRSARMRGVNFKNTLRLGACATGLRVSTMRILMPFARPFFVPWSQITPERQQRLMFKYVRLHLGDREAGVLTISESTYDEIARFGNLRLAEQAA